MKINFNGKQSLIIAGSAMVSGAVIFFGSKGFNWIRNRKKVEESANEKTEKKEEK